MEVNELEERINEILEKEGVSYKNRFYNKIHGTMSYFRYSSIMCFSPEMLRLFEDCGVLSLKLEPSKEDVGYMKIIEIEFFK